MTRVRTGDTRRWIVVLVHVDSLALSLFALSPDTLAFILDSHPPPSPHIAHYMVGTPQLPLKFRRKGADDVHYTTCIVDIEGSELERDMAHRDTCRPVPVSNFGTHFNPMSIPYSPGLSSSAGPSSSSPPRSLYTPEPPSSPLSDPFIASSSTASSPRSKHFWDVAFNYGPGFPYKPRTVPSVAKVNSSLSSPIDSALAREFPLMSHRRSSSESAPTLMSDMDTSEYSEDFDTFSIGGSPTLHNLVPSRVKIRDGSTGGENELGLGGGIHALEQLDVLTDTKDCISDNNMDVDIDIAAALLDLSRQVRIASVQADRKPVPIAIKLETPIVDLTPDDKKNPTQIQRVAEIMDTSILPHAMYVPLTSASTSPEQQRKGTNPDEEDAYMRREDFRSPSSIEFNRENNSTDADLLKVSDFAEELPSRETIELPMVAHDDKQLSSTEGIIICDKPRSDSPITTSLLSDERDILAAVVCDSHHHERFEPSSHIAISEEARPLAVETSHKTLCIRQGLLPESLKCEDGKLESDSATVAASTSNPAALDRDALDDVRDDRDDDTCSLAAFSIFSSTLTPISSPLTSPVDSVFESDFHIERLDSPGSDSIAAIAQSRRSSAVRDEDKDDPPTRSQSISRTTDNSRAPTPSLSGQSRSPDPVPGPSSSSSNVKSRTSSSPIGKDSCIRSRHAKKECLGDENGVSDDDEKVLKLLKARGVKSKQSKPKMLNMRGEPEDERKGLNVKANSKVTGEVLGTRNGDDGSVWKSKPMGGRKERKKRPRNEMEVVNRSRLSSPSLSSDVALPKPKRKRSRKTENLTTNTADENALFAASRSSTEAMSSRATSACPSELDEAVNVLHMSSVVDSDQDPDKLAKEELCGLLIQAMALARASSMPASSLIRELLRENPHLIGRRSQEAWIDLINTVLQSHVVFGRIDRQGLDAADKPLEPQWYYIPEKDWDVERATLLKEMMPKKRNETKKHKQYYYRPVSKITRWDPEDEI